MSLRDTGIGLLLVPACWFLSGRIILNGQPACTISGGSDLICSLSPAAAKADCTLEITDQPLPQTDCYGNHVEFSAGISGAEGTVIYQWQQKPPGGDFSDIPGANTSLLPVNNIGVNGENTDGSEYRVVVSDDCTTITSAGATLHINTITGLTPAVVNSTLCNGGSITYAVSTRGNIVGYQWAWNNGSGWASLAEGGAYSGTTGSQLAISNASPAQSASYRVSVTFVTLNQPPSDPTCVETSFTRTRNLVVRAPLSPPVISFSQQICHGSMPGPLSATPSTGGSGPPYSYQWQMSTDGTTWSNISGATSLTCSPPVPETTTYYRIMAYDEGSPSCGSVISMNAVITVIPLPNTSPIYHR